MAESDILAQLLLAQSRQQGRRQSASSRLADQMMASANNVTPVYSTGAALARAGSGLLAGLMAQRAEAQDLAREDEQMQRLQDRTDKRDYLNRQELTSFLGGPSQAPPQQQPIQAAPQQAMSPVPDGAVQREPLPPPQPSASVPGRPPIVGSNNANLPENRGPTVPNPDFNPQAPEGPNNLRTIENPWHDLRGQLPAPNGRVAASPFGGAAMPGQAPQPAPRSAQAGAGAPPQSDAMTMYLRAVSSSNPMISRLAPGYLAQANREDARAGRVNPTVEINGPQGPGTYERRQDGALAFIGGRMPPQEGAETFTGAPQTVMQNGQPVLVQMGSRGTVRPMQGYGPRNEGQFGGTSMDAQSLNILLAPNADPSSPTYAAAFNQVYGPRTVTQEDGTVVTIQPQPPAGIRAPVVNSQQPAAQPQAVAPASQPAQSQASGGAVAPEVTQTTGATVTRVPGTTGTLTESQSRSNMFGNAMSEGHRILQDIQIPSNATLLAWRNAPETLVNMTLNQNDQQYFNALRQFAAGVLRKETGAAFSNSELMDVQSRFFPMPGDSLLARQQKARARQQAIESMRVEIPGGFRGQLPPAPASNAPSTEGWSGRVLP